MEIGEMKWGTTASVQLLVRSAKGRLNVQLVPNGETWLIAMNEVDEEDFARMGDTEGGQVVSTAKKVARQGGRVLGVVSSFAGAIKEAEKFAQEWLRSEE